MSSVKAPNGSISEFDEYAEDYDTALSTGISISGETKDYFAEGRVRWLKKVLQELGQAPRSVLDFGCGTGSSTRHFLNILDVESMVGLDVSSNSLRVAEKAYGHNKVKFLQVNQYDPCGEIDLAFSNGVFHHIALDERASAIDYVYRSLRSHGLFAFWENNPLNPGTRYVMRQCPFDQDAIPLSHFKAQDLVRHGGFEIIRVNFLFIFPRFLSFLRPIEPFLSRWPVGGQYLILCRKI
jgi:SAM-dependent methyltransferase